MSRTIDLTGQKFDDHHLKQRFFDKIEIGGDCWEWIGCKSRGYGQLKVGGKMVYATHVSWYLFFYKWPNDLDLLVLHHCDNPSCVNPGHLFLGTHQDNMYDMLKKGRTPRGENHGRSKLTQEEVIEIRKMYATGDFSLREVAEMFTVSKTTIHPIVNRKTWTHV